MWAMEFLYCYRVSTEEDISGLKALGNCILKCKVNVKHRQFIEDMF